jgi:hypothetical protein
MFCPICKAEYRLGFTRCNDCDVDLVENLADVEAVDRERDGATAELLWTGTDPVTQESLCRALDEAEVFYHRQEHAVGELPIPASSVYTILIHRRDRSRAEAVLEELRREAESEGDAAANLDEQGAEEPSSDAEASLTDTSDEASEVPDDIVPEFDPEEATAEVWSGEQQEMAQALEACLRENGIGCVVDDSGGMMRIRVVPDSEVRAREIVREVVEGTPPE